MRRMIVVLALAGLSGGVYANDQAAPEPAAAAPAPAASTATPVEPASAAAHAAPEAVAMPAAAAAPAAPGAAAAPAASGEQTVLTMATPPPDPEFKVPSGYKPRTQGLETVYCRTYQPMGSRVPRTDCYTKAQVKAIEEASAAARRELQQKAAGCVGSCGGS